VAIAVAALVGGAAPAYAHVGGTNPPRTPENPHFEHLTVDDGLPENSVRAIVQDNQGFLWFGTQNGLVRWDGYEMVPFRPSPESALGNSSLAVLALLEDSRGDLWIGTFISGLWRLHFPTGDFTHWGQAEDGTHDLGGNHVADLCEGPDGGIWVALANRVLTRLDPLSGTVNRFKPDLAGRAGPPDAVLTTVMADARGRIWVGSEGAGLALFAPEGGRWTYLCHDPSDPGSLPSDLVNDIFTDPAGHIWVATRHGLARWDPDLERFASHTPRPEDPWLPENYLVQITADPWGRLWIGAAVGLHLFDPISGRFHHFAHDPERPGSPVNGPVLSIFCDRSGIVWGGSWHAGLNKLDPGGRRFSYLVHDPDDPGSLDHDAVLAVHEDTQGVLWVGTGVMPPGSGRGGLNSRQPGTAAFAHHPFQAEDGQRVSSVVCLHEDGAGELWLGTNYGLWHLDPRRGVALRVSGVSDGAGALRETSIRCLVSDAAGNLWIGTAQEGVFVREQATGRLTHHTHDPAQPSSLAQNNIVAIFRDSRNRILIGTDTRGLDVFDPATGGFRHFFDQSTGLASIIDIHEDTAGRIWLGTYAGLTLFDPDTGGQHVWSSRNGLPNDMVAAILEDEQGRLWLSTGKGFARLDPASGELKTYDTRDGLPTNEVHFAHCSTRDCTLYFGGNHGLVHFAPREICDSEFLPPLVITELRVADRPVTVGADSPLTLPVNLAEEVFLPHDQNDLALTFAALHFARPERNRYRYRLENYDRLWRNPQPGRTAFYTNLAPGEYLFRAEGTNADGVWGEVGATLRIVIQPPWWRTGWAYTLYAALILGFVGLVYRQIVQRERMRTSLEIERAEARQLQQLDQLKSRFFANISHEFRTPLTLLRGPLQRLQEDPAFGEPETFAMMARNTARLGQLIDQLLDLSRLEAGRLPLQWRRSDCLGYLRVLVSSFESLAQDRAIALNTRFPAGSLEVWFDPDFLEKIITNLLSNALKFTPDGGEVLVTVHTPPEVHRRRVPHSGHAGEGPVEAGSREVVVEVANTGSFIPPQERERIFDRFHRLPGGRTAGGTGIGLALVKELVEWHGGSVTVDSDPDRGTCFTVSLPVFLEAPGAGTEEPLPPPGMAEVAGEPLRRAQDGHRQSIPVPRAAPHEDEAATPAASVQPLPAEEEADKVSEAEPTRLLIVEDNDDLRAYLRKELAADFGLLEAADGEVGLTLALAEIPDLVLSDVMMPGIDGFELCRRLKEDERTSHIPVILLTARVESESRLTGLRTGADDYLAKPFDPRELRVRIENLITQRRKLRERFAHLIVNLEPSAMPVTSADERFLRRAREVVEEHLADPDFKVDTFCREIAMSRAQLHRKLKAVTGQSTREFIRTHRLQRAAQLLEGGYGNVTDVAYAVGFRHLSYFSKSFRAQYGVQPSDYPPKG